MAIERHPFQFFLAGIADKMKGEDMAITRLQLDEDGYLDKTVNEIVAAAQEGFVIIEINLFNEPPDVWYEDIYYFGNCHFDEDEDAYIVSFFSYNGTIVSGTPVLSGISFSSIDKDGYPQFFD